MTDFAKYDLHTECYLLEATRAFELRLQGEYVARLVQARDAGDKPVVTALRRLIRDCTRRIAALDRSLAAARGWPVESASRD